MKLLAVALLLLVSGCSPEDGTEQSGAAGAAHGATAGAAGATQGRSAGGAAGNFLTGGAGGAGGNLASAGMAGAGAGAAGVGGNLAGGAAGGGAGGAAGADGGSAGTPVGGAPALGDECDFTEDCRQKYGPRATDCVGSASETSVCQCGPAPCWSLTPGPDGTLVRVYPALNDYSRWAEFANPERGIYRSYSGEVVLSTSTLRGAFEGSPDSNNTGGPVRLVHWYLPLLDYRQTDVLPTSFLADVAQTLSNARAAGVKLIPRMYYLFRYLSSSAELASMPSIARIQAHIAQLGPVFAEQSDVISHFYAGCLGAWGEWHRWDQGSGFGFTNAERDAVFESLVEHFPSDRQVSFRYPWDIRRWFPTVLSSSQAYDGSRQSRTAHVNDCWNSSTNDVGTWSGSDSNQQIERDYISAMSRFTHYSGEPCAQPAAWGSLAQQQAVPTRDYLAAMHATGLNANLWSGMWQHYDAIAISDEMKARFGYLFKLVDAELDQTIVSGRPFSFRFTLRNDGWGRLHNPRLVQLVLRSADGVDVTRITLTQQQDNRLLLPGAGEERSISYDSISLPSGVAPGEYDVLLAMPDPDSRISERREYAIKFWNPTIWNEALAAHELEMRVSVE